MAYRSSHLPAAEPDSDGPIFGIYDLNDSKCLQRRKHAQNLYQNQLQMAAKKKENEIHTNASLRREEEEMLRKTKAE